MPNLPSPLRALVALLLAVSALLLAAPLRAQQTTVLFENSTGALTRPAASTFRSANGVAASTSPTFSTGFTLSTASATTAFQIAGRPIVWTATEPDSAYEFFTWLPTITTQSSNRYGGRVLYTLNHQGSGTISHANGGLLAEVITESTNSTTYTNRQHGLYGYLNHNGSGRMNTAIGTYSVVVSRGAGGIDNARGFDAVMGTENIHGTGDVTAMSGYHMRTVTRTGGTITNLYGLYVDSQTAATNNWAVYTAGTTPSYFGGPVTLPSITGPTTVTGSLTVTSAIAGQNNLTLTRTGAVDVSTTLTSDAGRSRTVLFSTPTARRIALTATDTVLRVTTYDDADAVIDNAMTINRAAGTAIAFVRPITNTSSILLSGASTSYGFTTGAGGSVTQATSKATGVTLDRPTGIITLHNAALSGETTVSFTFTNAVIASTDLVHMEHVSGGTGGAYTVTVFPASGSATVFVRNVTGGSLSEAIVLRFAVIKSVSS